LIISKATTTLISHFTSFFHFSPSPAHITLIQVITIIIIAKKNAAALRADNTKKNTDHSQIKAPVTHSNHQVSQATNVVLLLKLNTDQNSRFAP